MEWFCLMEEIMKNTNDYQKDAEEMLLTVIKYIKGELNQNEASKELQKLRSMAENSLNKTAELQQVLAQIEATLSRAETNFILSI